MFDHLQTLATDRLIGIDVDRLRMPWDGEREIGSGGPGTIARDELIGHSTQFIKRTSADLRPLNRGAVKHIANLPRPGHSYHYLICDKVTLWDAIPAILAAIAPQTIQKLSVSTLTFGPTTASELLALFDTGRIESIDFLISKVFQAKNGPLYDSLIPHLIQRGQRAAAMRTHAKVIAIQLSGAGRFVIESSSNLRSSKSVEQVAIICDSDLWAFHAGWIARALEQESAA